MSKEKLIRTINRELVEINEMIDLKVIKGASYRAEAKRHKLLVSMLNDISEKARARSSWSFASLIF